MKGMRMAGEVTGNTRVKVTNLQILKVVKEHNLVVLKGAVPGFKGSFIIVESKMELNVLNTSGAETQ